MFVVVWHLAPVFGIPSLEMKEPADAVLFRESERVATAGMLGCCCSLVRDQVNQSFSFD